MASLVIKVKYEETLRRLSVAVNGDQKLDLSIEGLRLKIRSLFNFPPEVNFRLTYQDEDGDLVTIADDDDLYDIVRQGLNPVRITVHLSSDQSAQSSSAPSSGSAIPSTASSQNVQPKFNVDEALKSLQEPLNRALLNLRSLTANSQQNAIAADARKILKSVQTHLAQALAKLQSDISSAPSSPILADLFDGLDKLRQLCLNAALSISGKTSGSNHNKDGNEVTKNDGIDTPVPIQPASKSTPATGLSATAKAKSASCESSANTMSSSGSTKSREAAFSGATAMHASEKESSFDTIIHKNVGCDGCGVLPISGPRFKSKVKYDYDLCSLCFSRMGNDLDYTRIDIPFPHYFSAFNAPNVSPHQSMARPYVPKHLRMGFDSRFVMDVNVIDGTTMAPSTPFTKTWRMHNNGSIPWTRGLRCVWIAGDRFSASNSVEVQVPLTGVDVASEINISVDFVAPDSPGRYISYWRMADPSGHEFGQRVWVQIQVDPSLDLTREKCPMLDLNLPPESNETAFPHVANVKDEPESDVKVGESRASSIPELNNNIETLGPNFPINDDLLVAAGSSRVPPATGSDKPVSPVAPSPVSSTAAVSASKVAYPTIDGVSILSNIHEQVTGELSHHVEAKMLKDLEQMGFKQTDLNREVLRMNTYDWERSVDDLCDVSEWDPLLEELQQMGFEDKETNKKLLAKNNGSITRVVMELIAEE